MTYYYQLDLNNYLVNWSCGASFPGGTELPSTVEVPEALKACNCNTKCYKYESGTITYDPVRAAACDTECQQQEEDNRFVTNQELHATYSEKTDINTDTSTTAATLTLINNQEKRYTTALSSLAVAFPTTVDDNFISSVVFISGSSATTYSCSNTVKYSGDDVTDNVFTAAASKTYTLMYFNDGINLNCIVRGV